MERRLPGKIALTGPAALACARRAYEKRRRRDAALAGYAALMNDQMWDIMLGLAILHHERRPISALAVPVRIQHDPGEGIRCVAVLRRLGLVEGRDGQDARLLRSVRLSSKGAELMARALAAC